MSIKEAVFFCCFMLSGVAWFSSVMLTVAAVVASVGLLAAAEAFSWLPFALVPAGFVCMVAMTMTCKWLLDLYGGA